MKLTIRKMAQALDLPEKTLERWIRQGRIPARHHGDSCSFNESSLQKWATAHQLPFLIQKEEKDEDGERVNRGLLSATKTGGVIKDLEGGCVEDVLRAASKKAVFLDPGQRAALFERMMEREELTSTGIGRGVAIPHPRTPITDGLESPAIMTCFLKKPVDFGAVDDKPVFVLFVLVSNSVKTHLHLLSRISFCMREDAFIYFLKKSPEHDEFYEKIIDFDKKLNSL